MPDKKCLYRERMESADSIASMANTSKNRLSAVGAANAMEQLKKSGRIKVSDVSKTIKSQS